MNVTDLTRKKGLILAHETSTARHMALHVIDKPRPRVWMIFIPIFFVFYFWKIKEYEQALKDFGEHYLIPYHRTLEAVCAAGENGIPIDVPGLVAQFNHRQETARVFMQEWLTLLAEHFQTLLTARGDSYAQLVRAGYGNKASYLLFCQHLSKAENTFNKALLKKIDGDSSELAQITQAMAEGLENLRLQESAKIFVDAGL